MAALQEFELTSASVADLVQLGREGSSEALDQLYVQFRSYVLTLAQRRMNNIDEAEELCQDVFIQAFRRLHQLNEPAAFAGWLRQIVHRMAINRQSRRKAPTAMEHDVLEATVCSATDTVDPMVRQEEREQVHTGLARLGALDRDTLTAFYIHGQSLIEMSEAFDAPVGTIKRRLHVARKRLAATIGAI